MHGNLINTKNNRKSITYQNEQEKKHYISEWIREKALHIGMNKKKKHYISDWLLNTTFFIFFFKFVFTVLFPYRIMLLMQFFRVLLFASWFNDTIIYELVI